MIQIQYLYKVYRNGQFLGCLPNVTSPFSYNWDINTAGTQITVSCGISADTSGLSGTAIQDETGAAIQDETGDTIVSDVGEFLVGIGSGPPTIIQNGNEVVVWKYDSYHPNGIAMFRGKIKRWEANFGGQGGDETVKVLIYSDGYDMQHHLVRGYGELVSDQAQTIQDDYVTTTSSPSSYLAGQTIVTGSSVNNIAAINLYMAAVSTSNTVTLYLCSSVGGSILGSTTATVSSTSPSTILFTFAAPIGVSPGASYFFFITASDTNGVNTYINDSSVYSSGEAYLYFGGSWHADPSQDLYFVTYTSPISTIVTYTSVDPSTGMVKPVMDTYASEGGAITYDSGAIEATGLSVTYKLQTNTVFEVVQQGLTLSPSGFYFYVDLGTDKLIFQQASTSADIVLTKGRHLSQITIIGTIEYIINEVYVIGGVVSGANIFTLDQDATSISLYGPVLDRHSDSHITDNTTGHIVGGEEVTENKNEQYQTTVTIVEGTIDTTVFKPGLIVGFNGFGSFADNLLAQIVTINYTPAQTTLTLGLLPRRLVPKVEQITRGLIALNTVNNPSGPS